MIVVLDAAAKGDELEFAERDARVRIIRDLGKGSGAARNLGIHLSLGHYIAFLDHDDWFEPNKLERQILPMLGARSLFSHTSYFAVDPDATRGSGRDRKWQIQWQSISANHATLPRGHAHGHDTPEHC